MLKTFFRHPLLLFKFVKILKSTRFYVNAMVADFFRDILSPINVSNKSKTVKQIMDEQGYINENLFNELISLLEKDKYVTNANGKIWLSRPIPKDIIKITEKKLVEEVVDSFSTFIDTTEKAILDRLMGKSLGEFDSGELRLKWNIALRGDFYRIQRDQVFNLTKLKLFCQNRKPPLNLLDYGCGSGDGTRQLYEFINKLGIEFNIEACDVSEGLMEIAQEDETLELPIYYFSLKEKKPRKDYYDAIFISQVLHWVEDPVKLIGELRLSLKEGGRIFGIQSNISKRLYQIDLWLRILGSAGFPIIRTFENWFKENDMPIEYDKTFGIFKATKKEAIE